ncbi:MAG: exopolysaccharide production protein ExoQ [Actinomycetota bacterium]|nr:exopolysaccharide production protein ExoQ [Actinomycetota bacterium]
MTENRIFRRGFAVTAFFGILAGDALRYSITWYGWGAVALILTAVGIVFLVKSRRDWRFNRLPYPMIAFLVLVVISIFWSDYPGWTAIGAFATLVTVTISASLAIAFTAEELLWAFGTALRAILALSLLFELVVSVFVRHPIVPWWTDYTGKIPAAFDWSRDHLLTGGLIQGIVGNSDLLGFLGLLGLIVFSIQLASRSTRPRWGIFWLVIAAACIALTRSGTVTIAIVGVVVATVVLLLVRHARTGVGRVMVYLVSLVVVVLGVVGALLFRTRVLELLDRSSTLTGRTGIWTQVIHLASQRPVVGWGWVSYWPPFVSPFNNKHFNIGGVQYSQAHEAWLDVWLQLGIVGLVVFGALVVSTLLRVWILAVERGGFAASGRGPYSALTLLPVLVLVALLVQSLAESRLLIEYGMLLLCLFAIRSKRDLMEPAAL